MSNVRWLVVGTGDIANKRVLPALDAEPRSEVAAVCDTEQARAEAAAAPRRARVFADYEAALGMEEVDAVYLCTPIALHVPHAVRALAAGKHVLVEKPVALNHAQAQELVAASRGSGRRCGVAYFRRFAPKYALAEEMLKAGEFGRVVLVRMTYFSWFNPARDDPKYWRVEPEMSGGGPLSDMGTHMFDVLIGLLGSPVDVVGRVETLVHDYAAEDSCVALLRLEGGAQCMAGFHWNSKTWSHEFEIVGTEAKLKWHPYDSDSVVKTVGRDIREIATPNHPNVHYPLIEDFVDAVLEGRDPRITPAEAAKTNRVIDALYSSSREGRPVRIADIA